MVRRRWRVEGEDGRPFCIDVHVASNHGGIRFDLSQGRAVPTVPQEPNESSLQLLSEEKTRTKRLETTSVNPIFFVPTS